MISNIVVSKVRKKSIGEKIGIEKGDMLLNINDNEIGDIIEYKFLICDENINITFAKPTGEIVSAKVKKDFYDDMGIEIHDLSMDTPKRCHNKCIFCFIDQLPQGMRESLYVKDDDSRLSFLQGNFVTLTNLSDEDLKRIIKYRISPINVSVHTTNPELRIKMLNNKRAGNIINQLKMLTDGGISINCQIVLCPDINDKEELKKTINDLFSFYPAISNVAVVPVGITKHRKNEDGLKSYDKKSAAEVIDLVEKIQEKFMKEIDQPFVRLADEFYLLAERNFPDYEHYEDFAQLEDGIGMARYFEHSVKTSLEFTDVDGNGLAFAAITGTMIYSFLKDIMKLIEEKLNIKINVYPIVNDFFGDKINVAGLLTGKDIIAQLKGVLKEKILLISKNMLKADEYVFLDDITIKDIERELDVKVMLCDYTGEDLVEKIEEEVIKWQNQ
ncbi:putative radical SAM enzyme, TIGR03279 family [Caloramator quimbayensis]|uniref:Putative radical SAM enzyme, TIGR03279 family n=1 Tax=Caloramator quimbayensis TaxID=1147123 RepID=A0A1T4X301_9CLOT|nr:DUF512 domain-containing protein [Caloramator quimbayensis]SKA83548.1 putative radical SAM enzyme, TIGR03279 family [Caloramator quimbayensis]